MLITKMKLGVVIGVIHGWAWDKVTHKFQLLSSSYLIHKLLKHIDQILVGFKL
jgi:hypothetical protein